mmetsp:Transcript_6465/g.7468  ORF Transcript_6465/g.7468 Transcript_6465/m.7468 type:complete len:80 (-) Transcript_6465:295-534(-)
MQIPSNGKIIPLPQSRNLAGTIRNPQITPKKAQLKRFEKQPPLKLERRGNKDRTTIGTKREFALPIGNNESTVVRFINP